MLQQTVIFLIPEHLTIFSFYLPLIHQHSGHTREYLMDLNPWSYKIMGQELINEDKYEEDARSNALGNE